MRYLMFIFKFLFKLIFRTVIAVVKYSILFVLFLALPYVYKHGYLYPMIYSASYQVTTPRNMTATTFSYEYNNKRVLVTNFHVCKFDKEMAVETPFGAVYVNVIGVDITNDLCILEPINIGTTLKGNTNYLFDLPVVSRGYMNGTTKHINEGYINHKHYRNMNMYRIITHNHRTTCEETPGLSIVDSWGSSYCVSENLVVETSIRITPGQSGSAVVDYFGSVTCVISSYDVVTKFSRCIPIEHVNNLIERNVK